MAGGEGGGESTDDHIDWLLLDPKHPDTQVRCEVIGCMCMVGVVYQRQ
jgi:hypothetical protein